ncbi:MAG: hypothetical protein ABJA67_03055 [Chthonomonadales bacterium]
MFRDRLFYIAVAAFVLAEYAFVLLTQQAIVNFQRSGAKELPVIFQIGVDVSDMLQLQPVLGLILAMIPAAIVWKIANRRRSDVGRSRESDD